MVKVTVLMAVYNGEEFIAETIESILNQTFTEFEFLIINDGSTDQTEDIILSYKDSRIKYVKNNENLRLIKSLNKGLDLSSGDFIARIDTDDIAEPDRLEIQYNFMINNPSIGLCGSFLKTFGTNNQNIGFNTSDEYIRFRLLFSTYIRHPSAMIRRETLVKNKIVYDIDYLHVEDHKMWVEISKRTKLAIIPQFLLKYRVHDNNISIKHQEQQAITETRIRREQLEELGLKVNKMQMKLYNNFVHLVRPEWNSYLLSPLNSDSKYFYELDELLRNLIIGNRKVQKVEATILETEFGKAYFKLLQHLSFLGVRFNLKALRNPLFEKYSLTRLDKLKLIIKAFFKKSYNCNKIFNYPVS